MFKQWKESNKAIESSEKKRSRELAHALNDTIELYKIDCNECLYSERVCVHFAVQNLINTQQLKNFFDPKTGKQHWSSLAFKHGTNVINETAIMLIWLEIVVCRLVKRENIIQK